MTQTLADWLGRRYPTAKKQTLRRMVADGRVRVNDRPAQRFNQPVAEADVVAVDESPTRTQPAGRPAGPTGKPPAKRGGASRPADREVPAVGGGLPFEVVFEDADVLVVHKPPGLLTSTVPREPRPTLLAAVRAYCAATDRRARVGLVHRLDRDASGLLVFSKTDPAYHSLKTQFYHHTVERVYYAIARGAMKPPTGRIDTKLAERSMDGIVYATKQEGRGQPASTLYETLKTQGKRSLLKVTLETGRKHQIRVHLSTKGCPIVGDTVYGPKEAKDAPGARLMLIAAKLGFEQPRTGERLTFELPLPEDFERMMEPKGEAGPAATDGQPGKKTP